MPTPSKNGGHGWHTAQPNKYDGHCWAIWLHTSHLLGGDTRGCTSGVFDVLLNV